MSIAKSVFGTLPSGQTVELYTLQNASGTTLVLTPYGCRIVKLLVSDRDGVPGDVVLGHATLEEYLGANFQGTFVGRYANRIGGASLTIDGVTYALDRNDGANTLHGGRTGYHQVLFGIKAIADGDEPSVTFAHTSPDGDENYPGTLEVEVQYTLTADNAVEITYRGQSDKKTVFNPTNHSFFNLKADGSKDVCSTVLKINATQVTAVSDDLIPTGELLSVQGTPLDFTAGKPIGQDIDADDHLIQLCGGFDHNFCADGEGLREIATAYEPESGRVMEVFSDMPGVQLFTANRVNGAKNKDGSPMIPHGAFCLETQFYPDSVHHENFPFRYVQPGVPFESKTIYKFSVK